MRTSASARAPQTPTVNELDEARRRFQECEPRDLFYRVATELIELALAGETRITVPEALAVLLQTWNAQYYQYRSFTEQHFREIEQLLETHLKTVLSFRDRSIDSVKVSTVANTRLRSRTTRPGRGESNLPLLGALWYGYH